MSPSKNLNYVLDSFALSKSGRVDFFGTLVLFCIVSCHVNQKTSKSYWYFYMVVTIPDFHKWDMELVPRTTGIDGN